MEKSLADGKMGEMVVGKTSSCQNQEQHPRNIFERNKLTFENYQLKKFTPTYSANIPKEWAEQILEIAQIADNEGQLPEALKPILDWIFHRYPTFKDEYEQLLEATK